MTAYTPEQAAQVDWPRRWESYGIPAVFQGRGIADLERTSDNARALDLAQTMVDNWPSRRLPDLANLPEDRSLFGRGQIYIGGPGAGKTALVCATATDIARRYNTAAMYMPVTRYFNIHNEIKDAESPAHAQALRRLKRSVLKVPLLIWDDMGKEYGSGSGWVGTEVYRVLRERFYALRPTLMTTNVPLPKWSEKYEGAMFSFLHEAFEAAAISGKDWRRAKR